MRKLFAVALLIASTASAGVVLPQTSASQLLIPAAGSVQGANGTFFRSDITLVNLATHDQNIILRWLPQGASATSTVLIHLAAQRALRSSDFVREILAQQGLGAILVTAVTGDGTTTDSTGALYVQSRIWTPQPGTTGTTSQSLPAVPVGAVTTQIAALFATGGADNPPNYRSNVGIVNLDPINAQTFLVLLPNANGATVNAQVTVQPNSMAQVSVGNGLSPTQQILIQNVTTVGRTNSWLAYGSTIDDVTGDAWSELAVAGTSQ